MLVDLHQDVAYYFLTSLNPSPFDVDAEGRQSDLPRLSGSIRFLSKQSICSIPRICYCWFHV